MKPDKLFYFTCPTRDHAKSKVIWSKLREAFPTWYIAHPFYYADGRAKPEIRQLDSGNSPILNNDDIVDNDLELIHMAPDGIIAFINEYTSHGSAMECWDAYRDGKPVYVLTEREYDQKHPWIYRVAGNGRYIFRNVYEFMLYAIEHLIPEDKRKAYLERIKKNRPSS